jgi:hypothetical protein
MHRALHLIAQTTLATAVLIAAVAIAQEGAAPAPRVGDSWKFKETDLLTKNEVQRYTEKLHAVGQGEYWTWGDNGRTRWWWRHDAAKATRLQMFEHAADAPEQRGKIIGTADGGFAKRWPLKVGESWDCGEDTTWPNGWRVKYELKCSVDAQERVETVAGSFDTFRIEAKGYLRNETNNFNGRHERSVWYAPLARCDVKREYRTWGNRGQLTRVEGHELIEFKTGE